MAAIAGRNVPTPELVLIGAGVVGVINLFLPWYRATQGSSGSGDNALDVFGADRLLKAAANGSDSVSVNAFGAGFLAWFPSLLVIAVAALVAARVFAGFKMPARSKSGPAFDLLAVSALATVLLVVKLILDSDFLYVGFFLGVLAAVAQTAVNLLAFRSSGEALPDFGRHDGSPPST